MPQPHAQAGTFTDLWRSRQRANGGAKLLAPIKVAQQRLAAAGALLPVSSLAAWGDVLSLVRASSLNCYAYEAVAEDSLDTRASLLTQQFGIADPCTFRLLVKSVTNLDAQAARAEGYALLDELVAAYQALDMEVVRAGDGDTAAAARVPSQLSSTLVLAQQLETFMRSALGVEGSVVA